MNKSVMAECKLKIGKHLIDILDPKPKLIDLDAVEDNLWSARRFSNNPKALTVRQHTWLVATLAQLLHEPRSIIQWCQYHDDHEAFIGDVPGPLKHYLNSVSRGLGFELIEVRLDMAICSARGISQPTGSVRGAVHFYDKLAETLEWQFVLGEPIAAWNLDWWKHMTMAKAIDLANAAKEYTRY